VVGIITRKPRESETRLSATVAVCEASPPRVLFRGRLGVPRRQAVGQNSLLQPLSYFHTSYLSRVSSPDRELSTCVAMRGCILQQPSPIIDLVRRHVQHIRRLIRGIAFALAHYEVILTESWTPSS
jgi:hypothetical protein